MQLVIKTGLVDFKKHQTLEILTKVDFYAFFFFKYSIFRDYWSSLVACVKIVVCILFHLYKIAQNSPNRIELDSSIL